MWIEMSRDEEHGGAGWGFLECLWSPTLNEAGNKQGWWEKQREIRAGDCVLHLRGDGSAASFIGISICASDCEVTNERPSKPGEWGYAQQFFRTRLMEFEALPRPIPLNQVFTEKEVELRTYFESNKLVAPTDKKRLFFVVQNGKLQCQNGAYFSEADHKLAEVLLITTTTTARNTERIIVDERISTILARVKQDEFSDGVLNNFGHKCCFPNCEISERSFLIGAHIARWTDAVALRGDISNGLCLCLMHDKAFELGLFTLDEMFRIRS
jgi:putative restriction endonuclease